MKVFRVLFGILLVCAAVAVVFLCLSVGTAPSNSVWLQTFTVVKDLRIAIGNFHADYHRFPGQPDNPLSTDLRIQSTGPFIECLIGQNKEWNPMEVMYMDLPKARNGRNGYIPADGSTLSKLVDRWGTPYVILLDTSGDDKIDNPDLKNSDSRISHSKSNPPAKMLAMQAAIFSFGQDGVEGTVDDIVSWRTGDVAASGADGWQAWIKVLIVAALVIGFIVALFIRGTPRWGPHHPLPTRSAVPTGR